MFDSKAGRFQPRLIFALLFALVFGVPAAPAQRSASADLERRVKELAREVSPAFVFIGGGSGVVISPDGYMLTNHHVAGSKANWEVTLTGGHSYIADVVGKDSFGDICLLKIRGGRDLPHVEMGDSDVLRTGEYVFAVGNPFLIGRLDWQPTVTLGTVSGIHRYQTNYSDAVQTDASINPGNSGGPLFNFEGKLVGINGQIVFRYGTKVNTGVGFAISTAQIKRFLPLLREAGGGEVFHGTIQGLGFAQQPSQGKGAPIGGVQSGSSAERAGFRRGDWIVRVEEYPVVNARRAQGFILAWPAGSKIRITIRRGGREETLEVTLDSPRRRPPQGGGQPEPEPPEQPEEPPEMPPELGEGRVELGVRLETSGGLRVAEVTPGSPAAAAGIRVGDQIRRFAGRRMREPQQLLDSLSRIRPGQTVPLTVERNGAREFLRVAFPRN